MSTWEIELVRRAERDLERLPEREHDAILEALALLADDPYSPAGLRKLTDRPGFWRVRVGDYRIIFTIARQRRLVTVERIAHRREAYR
jgi:mRNA interferase RelE/StbE